MLNLEFKALNRIVGTVKKSSTSYRIMNIINIADGMSYFGMLTLLTIFLTNSSIGIEMSQEKAGLSVSIFTGAVTIFMTIGGSIVDRLGVRKSFTLALTFLVIGRFFLSLSPYIVNTLRPLSSFLSLGVIAFGMGILNPALYVGVKEYVDEKFASISYGVVYAVTNAGIVISHLVSPFIREKWDVTGVFFICSCITLCTLIMHLLFFTQKIENKEKIIKYRKKKMKRNYFVRLKEYPIFDFKFILFIFALLPVRTLFVHKWVTLPAYIERCYDGSISSKLEWVTGLNPFIIIFFVPFFAYITRKLNVLNIMIVGTIISSLGALILSFGVSLQGLIIHMIIFSFGEAIWCSRFNEYVAKIAPPDRLGMYMGIAGVPWFIAKITTGFYSGWMIETFIPKGNTGDSVLLWLYYSLFALTTPLILIISKRWLSLSEKRLDELGTEELSISA